MSRTVEIEGQQVAVYTEAEVEQERERARAGLVPASERDSAAAAARREAEADAVRLKAELQTAQAGSQRAQELESQLGVAQGQAQAAQRILAGVRVLSDPSVGLTPAQAEMLLFTPLFAEVDLANEEARKGAVETLKQTFPGLFQRAAAGADKAVEFGGAGGGVGGGSTVDVAAIEKMSQAEYEKYRSGG